MSALIRLGASFGASSNQRMHSRQSNGAKLRSRESRLSGRSLPVTMEVFIHCASLKVRSRRYSRKPAPHIQWLSAAMEVQLILPAMQLDAHPALFNRQT